jgi:hypothetical protein
LEKGAPQRGSKEGGNERRARVAARVLIVLASVLAFVAVLAIWANRQLLETDNWVETSSALLEDDDIKDAVADFLVEAVFSNVDVKGELESKLPPQTRPLAGPISGALRGLGGQAARAALDRPKVQELWENANRLAHEQFITVVEGGGENISTEGGVVTLNLIGIAERVGEQTGINVADKIPPEDAQIEILQSDQLAAAQDAVSLLRDVAIVLTILVLGLYALAIYLAKGWRREALRAVGIGFVAVGIAVLVARSIAGNVVVDALASTESVRPAAEAAWSIGTSLLSEGGVAMIFYGVFIVIGAWLAGPTALASGLRRALAPAFHQRWIAYAGLALIVVLLFWWAPTEGFRRLVPSLILIALLVAGTEVLRRQTIREFPGETWDQASARWRELFASMRGRVGEAVPGAAAAPAEDRVAQLERLGKLRDSGVLDEEEFAAEKQRLLGA